MRIKHHYFRQRAKKTISIRFIDKDDQQVDFFTKYLAAEKFKKFRKLIMGRQMKFLSKRDFWTTLVHIQKYFSALID